MIDQALLQHAERKARDLATMVGKLQDDLLEQARLTEQARALVDRLMNEPKLCDECRRRAEGFE